MRKLLPASLALALAVPGAARADASAEIGALRQEIEAMRAAYEARLHSLEQRLNAAEAAAAGAATAPTTASAAASPAAATAPAAPWGTAPAGAVADAPATPPPTAPAGSGIAAFNPALSLILSGLYTRSSKDPDDYAITGFPRGEDAEIGPGTRGLSLAESELALSASIDPWLRGAINIALHPDDSVSVEEGYIQTTSLGAGFALKAGRFFSNVGYLNPQHSHTWDFVDNPLAYQAMLGTQYGDDGVQLSWLAPTEQYLELGAELGRGRGFPGGDDSRNGAGMVALTAHTGGDVGDSHSWRAGLSVLRTRSDDQALKACRGRTVRTRRAPSRATPACGSPTRCGSGRRAATPRGPVSSCRANTCTRRAAATSPSTPRASTAATTTARSSRAGTCRASTSSCPAGASGCAPSGSTPARPTTASTHRTTPTAATSRTRTA